MHGLTIILLVVAAVCFGLATLSVSTRVNLIALGLLAWVLSVLTPLVSKG